MKYKVVVEPQDEGGYTVYVPTLPGCVSQGETVDEALDNIKEAIEGCHSYGQTREEALENIADAIQGCLAALKKHGHKIPEREVVRVEEFMQLL